MIKCHRGGCNHWNVPALSHDLLDMIDTKPRPVASPVSRRDPGIICVNCAKPLDPKRFGRWVHGYPERHWLFAGYHIPQIIMPMHYASEEKWGVLVGKLKGQGNTTFTTFLNEVCGESYDEGSKLLTVTDLKAAAVLPWNRDWRKAMEHLGRGYLYRILAVDWGGGGGRVTASKGSKKEKEGVRERTSFTTLSVLGIRANGVIECIWGFRSLKTHDYMYEVGLIIDTIKKFGCSHLVHDYNGAGAAREALLIGAGFPLNRCVPMAYHPTGKKNILILNHPSEDNPRAWYSLDKARSLVTTAQCVKYGMLKFFEYDYKSADNAGLLHDFLNLMEEKTDTLIGNHVYRITTKPNSVDDFAQATNYGCAFLWHLSGMWPNLAEAARFTITDEQMEQLEPGHIDWEGMI
jgi:hypothetical protein